MQYYENQILFINFDYTVSLTQKQQYLMFGGESIMHSKANYEIRRLVKESGIYLWQLAYSLGISDSALSRKLRKELSDQEKNKMLRVISSLKKGGL